MYIIWVQQYKYTANVNSCNIQETACSNDSENYTYITSRVTHAGKVKDRVQMKQDREELK